MNPGDVAVKRGQHVVDQHETDLGRAAAERLRGQPMRELVDRRDDPGGEQNAYVLRADRDARVV